MKNLFGQIIVNVNGIVGEETGAIHPETIVAAKLSLVLPSGEIVEMNVAEVLDLNLIRIDPNTGIEIHSELEL